MSKILEQKTFVDAHVDLTGATVRNCRFDGCVLVLNGRIGSMTHSIVENCKLEGDEWRRFLGAIPT